MKVLVGGAVIVAVIGLAMLLWHFWDRFPEFLQWLLLLPMLGLSMMAIGSFVLVLRAFEGEEGFWAALGQAASMSWVWFALVFELAPRAKARVGWVFYLLTMSFMGLALILMTLRGLGLAGLLPIIPPPEWAHWSRQDSIEVAQAVIWIAFGTASFRSQLRKSRDSKNHPVTVMA